MNTIAKCTVCGRGYVVVFSDNLPCADYTCTGKVMMLPEPVPENEWHEPTKHERELAKQQRSASESH